MTSPPELSVQLTINGKNNHINNEAVDWSIDGDKPAHPNLLTFSLSPVPRLLSNPKRTASFRPCIAIDDDEGVIQFSDDQFLCESQQSYSTACNLAETEGRSFDALRGLNLVIHKFEYFSSFTVLPQLSPLLLDSLSKIFEAAAQLELLHSSPFLAVKRAEKALQLRPDWPAALVTLARSQLALGELSLSCASFQQAIVLDPSLAEDISEDMQQVERILQNSESRGLSADERSLYRSVLSL